MSNRRKLVMALGAGVVVALPVGSAAQKAGKVWRIGFSIADYRLTTTRASELLFGKDCGDLGYVEGKNIIIEERYADGRRERLHALAAEIVRLPLDVSSRTAGALRSTRLRALSRSSWWAVRSGRPGSRCQSCAPGRERHGAIGPTRRPCRQTACPAQGSNPFGIAYRRPLAVGQPLAPAPIEGHPSDCAGAAYDSLSLGDQGT